MYDMVGLLLMVRINYQHRLLMNKRRVPALDGYLDRLNLTLWPRFKAKHHYLPLLACPAAYYRLLVTHFKCPLRCINLIVLWTYFRARHHRLLLSLCERYTVEPQ